ncbi:UTRA domain-containing protein [Bradyrhizobium sp. WU425]|uniref:UTRA domain-containing protein n=1 Tax=Bradyrhizobium sp. WU425 TaxID=187029 RepID=UPI001E361C49|nr:UTRA domain-containing protein [Bradyrhizobium canariense]UFW71335.1 UTRA domain-containing protein [Bradyrhizobium canariense]
MKLLSERISDPVMLTFRPPREAMLCVRKTIFIDDMPFLYDSTYLSTDVDGEIVDEFAEQFVAQALRRHSILVTNTDLIIDAAPATGQFEELFGVPTGYPILRRCYKFSTDTADDRSMVFSRRHSSVFPVLSIFQRVDAPRAQRDRASMLHGLVPSTPKHSMKICTLLSSRTMAKRDA